ncbi:CRISPR-associated protein Cas4 [Anaerobranca gottschalkii]|uniref:CRISPR-associated exonuclease Cas4 n=1 Tax=Anaerobranca gottschalkii DSM 13577 TaxID=1120990 RepID=A0A1I0B9Q7_9FIRM|nr:CRISPR-associated protein Cas4 [Anaerobranca gottschalkii]SET03533.1 CRISPR-associated exonuclease, Cas4 family [Anaerobranca gottschalkii DSM 13577]
MFYSEDELLMLSGIQHFSFCQRQWAIIHLENQWKENLQTVEGNIIHNKVNDPYILESRGKTFVARSVPLISYQLGLYGYADVVEFIKVEKEGVAIRGKRGLWTPIPVEYKRGNPKPDERDEVQLCAQAICLEEMLQLSIQKGYIFYHAIRRRTEVVFTEELRSLVKKLSKEMHETYKRGVTPKGVYSKKCKLCSLFDLCQPKILNKKITVKEYIKKGLDEE